MKELKLTEFRQICDNLSPAKYIYDTDNQIGCKASDLKMILFFNKVVVSLAPNCICFQGEGGNLRLDRVKSIRLYDDTGIPDLIFAIECGNLEDDKDNKTCVITMKKFLCI